MQEVVRSQIRLPRDTYRGAKQLASTNGISLNQLIVESINEKIMKRACSPTKVEQALKLITFALEQNNHV